MVDSDRQLNLLVAYPYITPAIRRLLEGAYPKLRFLLDSGAFTAWKSGKPISVDDYCKFIEGLPVAPWRYFTLDVIGDPAGTMRNYETMRARGFTPVPIFTRGEDVSVLDDYYKTSDVVGVGGLVGTPGNKGFVNGIMKAVGERRVHWLGFTSLPYLKVYRPYMCDTSSWETGAQYAAMKLYIGAGRTRHMDKAMFARRPDVALCTALRSYGVEPTTLAFAKNWSGRYSTNRALAAHSGVRLSLDVQEKLGTLAFMAASTNHAIELLIRGYDYETERRHT